MLQKDLIEINPKKCDMHSLLICCDVQHIAFFRTPLKKSKKKLILVGQKKTIVVYLNNNSAAGKTGTWQNLCLTCLLSIYFDLFSHARFTWAGFQVRTFCDDEGVDCLRGAVCFFSFFVSTFFLQEKI